MKQRAAMPATVASLSIDVLYVAPSGRKCRLISRRNSATAVDRESYAFVYTDSFYAADPWERDGFRLTPGNVGILREVV